MNINVKLSMLGRMFMLPASVVDEYLRLSDGDHIKVLLCVYCLGKDSVDTEKIAQMAGVDEVKVNEAIVFFSKLGVLSCDGITAAKTQPAADSADTLKTIGMTPAEMPSKRDVKKAARVRYSPAELSKKIDGDKELKELVSSFEVLLSKPLTHSNLGDVIEMYEHLELSPAAILMIGEYCKGLGKLSTAYILRVAQDWFDEGISGFDEIERKIINLSNYSTFENRVKKLIGIETNITKRQRRYFESWQALGFDTKMVGLAYEINIDNTGKLSLPYMNKVLTSWAAKGIFTPAAVDDEQQARKLEKQKDKPFKSGVDNDEFEQFASTLDLAKLT
ncbi:MAG: DnaD domain protein [Ruminococcus sp.]|nr:DnaD domain protein [Ruminococcus sp.]MBR1750289.1 DnaD domain protein [Ruminococcus sp.]